MTERSLEDIQAQATQLLKSMDTNYQPQGPKSQFGGYHQAAAVLSEFSPATLRPVAEADLTNADELEALKKDCYRIGSVAEERYVMLPEVRREVLEQLGSRTNLRQALNANPDRPQDAVQTMLDQYIPGDAPPLEEQNAWQLAGSFKAVQWMDGIVEGLPEADAVQQRWEQVDLIQPFNDLAGDEDGKKQFYGREKELAWVRSYIRDEGEKPILVIYGPGGVGKSALLARFIIENANAPTEETIPLAYIDFDQPGIDPDEPLTLVIEIVRQLGIQYPEQRTRLNRLRTNLREILVKNVIRRQESELGFEKQVGRSYLAEDPAWSSYLSDLSRVFYSLDLEDRPFLLSLDTFEEVQYRSSATVTRLLRFLHSFREQIPLVRPVLSGRNLVNVDDGIGFDVTNRELKDFDLEAATAMLEDEGIPRPLANVIVTQVGGNPLSLRLALDLWQRDLFGIEGVLDLDADDLLEFKLQEGLIQGQLFARILEHIHDNEIQPLAHPGLVLRRITPELIQKVLAKPCGVKVRDPAHADDLFDRLAQEESLVTVTGRVLRHRSDVRRIMVRLLRATEEKKVEQIERAAIRYYSKRETPEERAEEIYHRLSLKQSLSLISKRWADAEVRGWAQTQDMRRPLYSAREELEGRERAWLAANLDFELTAAERQEADQASWEKETAKRALRLLNSGEPRDALDLMLLRADRLAGSPLFLLTIEAYKQLEDWGEARETVTLGIRSAAQKRDRTLAVDLRLQSVRIDIHIDDLKDANRRLDEAQRLVERGDCNPLRLLEIDLHRLVVSRAADDRAYETKIIANLCGRFGQTSDGQLKNDPTLIAWLAAEIGVEYDAIMARTLRLIGLRSADGEDLQELVVACANWDVQVSEQTQSSPGELARQIGLRSDAAGSPIRIWRTYFYDAKPEKIGRDLAQLLESTDGTPVDVLVALVKSMRERAGERAIWPSTAGELTSEAYISPEEEVDSAITLETISGVAVTASEKSLSPSSAATPVAKLTGAQNQALMDAFVDAFSYDELEEMLKVRLDLHLSSIALAPNTTEVVFQLIGDAEQRGYLLELLDAARNARPENARLSALATEFGLGSMQVDLEQIVSQFTPPIDITRWRSHLAVLETQICRVEMKPQNLIGTGFLIGPDVVLTAYSVVEPVITGKVSPAAIELRFDHSISSDGAVVNPGLTFGLEVDWLVDSSKYSYLDPQGIPIDDQELPQPDELGYALLRVVDRPGYSGIGSLALESYAETRGWIAMPAETTNIESDTTLMVVGFSGNGQLRLSIGLNDVVGVNGNQTRLLYRTKAGTKSVGAPCFDDDFNLIAMHLGQSEQATWGVPISTVALLLEARGHGAELEGRRL